MNSIFQQIHPGRVSIIFVTISTWLIFSAFFMQIVFDIRPCELCLYQRYPHLVVMFGAVLVPLRFFKFSLFMQALAYGVGAVIALFHTGVERKWWKGLDGCSVSDISELSIEMLHQKLMNTAIVKCDEISWSFMGLSLTNYNLIISTLLAFVALYFLWGYHAESQRP